MAENNDAAKAAAADEKKKAETDAKAKADADKKAKAEVDAKAKAEAEKKAGTKPKRVRVICEGTLGEKLLKTGDVTNDPEYVALLESERGRTLVEEVK